MKSTHSARARSGASETSHRAAGPQRVGRNAPCWCGSGAKYKKCHIGREAEPPLLKAVLGQKLRSANLIRKCLHPAASPEACDEVISAHTVQRGRAMRAIMDTGQHVLTFHPDYRTHEGAASGPFRVGWKRASTIPAFCGRHDSSTFTALEATAFTGSLEQCFLLGYRAVCQEWYEKCGATAGYEVTRRDLDRGFSPEQQAHAQDVLRVHNHAVHAGLADLDKPMLDAALLTERWDACSAVVVSLHGPVCITTAGSLTPDRDFYGARLVDLADGSKPADCLSVAVDVSTNGPSVVFCWKRGADKSRDFVESILSLPERRLVATLPQLFLFYLSNTYFSPSWWAQEPFDHRAHLASLARAQLPYSTNRVFIDEATVPWRIAGVRRH